MEEGNIIREQVINFEYYGLFITIRQTLDGSF